MRRLTGLLAALALAAAPPSALAQLEVFDPGNYAQNLLQAARALDQIQNQVRSLQNEAQMLLNQQRNLEPLGFSALGALQSDMARVNGLLAQAGRIANDAAGVRAELDRNYTGAGSDRALAVSAAERWRNSLEALRRLLEVQGAVADSVAATQAQAAQIADRSQGAEGALQAAQAGNQLLAVQAKQLADLTALLAAQGRAEAMDQGAGVAAAAEAKARLQRFLGRSVP